MYLHDHQGHIVFHATPCNVLLPVRLQAIFDFLRGVFMVPVQHLLYALKVVGLAIGVFGFV